MWILKEIAPNKICIAPCFTFYLASVETYSKSWSNWMKQKYLFLISAFNYGIVVIKLISVEILQILNFKYVSYLRNNYECCQKSCNVTPKYVFVHSWNTLFMIMLLQHVKMKRENLLDGKSFLRKVFVENRVLKSKWIVKWTLGAAFIQVVVLYKEF